MAVVDRHIATTPVDGLTPAVINQIATFEIGVNPQPALSASNHTAATLASSSVVFTTSNTFGMPQARNLRYSCSYTGASTNGLSAGTLYIYGRDLQGRAMTESVALTSLAVATSLDGTKRFADTCTYSVRGYGEYSTYASKSASDSVTFQVGIGPVFGLPHDIKKGYETYQWRSGSIGTDSGTAASQATSFQTGALVRVLRSAMGNITVTNAVGTASFNTHTATNQVQILSGNAVQGGGGLSVVSTALLTTGASSQNVAMTVHYKPYM